MLLYIYKYTLNHVHRHIHINTTSFIHSGSYIPNVIINPYIKLHMQFINSHISSSKPFICYVSHTQTQIYIYAQAPGLHTVADPRIFFIGVGIFFSSWIARRHSFFGSIKCRVGAGHSIKYIFI